MPADEKLTLDQAAEILGRTRKAVEQLFQHDALRVDREIDRKAALCEKALHGTRLSALYRAS
jgi:hypothetical protein